MKLSVSQSFELKCTVEVAFDDTLDCTYWTEFAGYAFIPGIVRAIPRTPGPIIVGSTFDVSNSDGSTHVEQVVALDRPRTSMRRIFGLSGAFALLVRQMEETWTFSPLPSGCIAQRVFEFEVTNPLLSPVGAVLLVPFRKAMQRHAERIAARLAGETNAPVSAKAARC